MKINTSLNNILGNKCFESQRNMTVPLSYPKDECFFGSSYVETKQKNYQDDKKLYESKLQSNPRTAFLYNPDITQKKRIQMAAENPDIYDIRQTARLLGLKSENQVLKWIKEGKFEYDVIPRALLSTAYIDIRSLQNTDFISTLKNSLPNCRNFEELLFEYNITKGRLESLIKEGQLIPLESTYKDGDTFDSFIFDITDEENNKVLTEHTNLNPVPSKKYYKKSSNDGIIKPIMVPVTYLSKLGYSSAKQLANMIKNGNLPGTLEKVETQNGPKIRALVNIGPYLESKVKLNELRQHNKNVISTSELAKNLRIRKLDVDEALLNGEIEIIKEYIFPEDSKKVLIDLSNPQNSEFVDRKIFENQLLEEIKTQRQAELKQQNIQRLKASSLTNSLRMRIVWELCPMTRLIASSEAQKDGYVCSIIAKEAEDEELNEKEQIVLNSFRKKVWSKSGIEEFKQAQAKATEYIKTYKAQGIEAIDDETIRRIISEFYSSIN